MNNKLTGIKDVDREVLKHVSDKDLINVCVVNRKFWSEVCDDNFLRRRLSKYPGVEKYKREDETWRRFFLRFIYYVSKMQQKYGFEYTSGDFKKQYVLLNEYIGVALLYQAAQKGELPLVKFAKIEKPEYFTSILILASQYGHLDIVKYAIEKGADIHNQSDVAVRIASRMGYLDVVKFLEEKGADIHILEDTPLILAAENGDFDLVKYLVEKGADVHTEDDYPVRAASENGFLHIVKYLAENGANIHAQDNYALRKARKRGHKDVVEYLESLP